MKLESFGVSRTERTLTNGSKVVLYRKPNSPIYIRANIKAGACFDPIGKEGLSHFMEHMISNGSERFPNKELLVEHIESVGGLFGLATSNELLWVNTEIASIEDLQRSIDIFEATIVNPLLDVTKFENEKKAILAEYGKALSNPERFLYEEICKLIFNKNTFNHSALGNLESINAITYLDVINHFHNFVTPENMCFVAAGDIDIDTLEKALNTLKFTNQHTSTKELSAYEPSISSLDIHVENEAKQNFLFFGFKGTDVFSKQAICLRLLGMIMAGARTSRLTKKLRYEKGLVYNISAVRYGNKKSSVFGVQTDALPQNLDEVIETIKSEYKNLCEYGVKESELQFVKNKLLKSQKRDMQTSQSWINFHGYGETMYQSDNQISIDVFSDIVESITLEDLNTVVKEFISLDSFYKLSIGKK